MKNRFLIIFSILLLLTLSAKAQKFKNSAGFKIGSINGPVYQKHYNDKQAYEIILGFHNSGMQVYILNEWYKPLSFGQIDDFYLYFGVGGHVGYSKYKRDKFYYDSSGDIIYDYQKDPYYSIGADGIVGIEYRIYEVPLTIGIEYQPLLDFYGLRYVHFDASNFQVSIKYIF